MSPPESVYSPFPEQSGLRLPDNADINGGSDAIYDGSPFEAGVENIFPSLVSYTSNGLTGSSSGGGLIIDESGLAVVNWEASALDLFEEVTLIVADTRVRACVVSRPPAHRIAVLKFDTEPVRGCLRAWQLTEGTRARTGREVTCVSFNRHNRTVTPAKILDMDEDPADDSDPLRFAFRNITCELDIRTPDPDGVLLDDDGRVIGLVNFESKNYIPANELREVVEHVLEDRPSTLWYRNFDVTRTDLAYAFQCGLSREKWRPRISTQFMLEAIRVQQNPLQINKQHPLQINDIILEVQGNLVTRIEDLGFQYRMPSLHLLVLRDGVEKEIEVPLFSADDICVNEFIQFCGAYVLTPNMTVRMTCGKLYSEILIGGIKTGSPAMADLAALDFITMVNGTRVTTCNEFLGLVQAIPYDEVIRLQVIDAMYHNERTALVRKNVFFPLLRITRTKPYSTGNIITTMVDYEAWTAGLQKHDGIGGSLAEGLSY
jgi:hypothetical protein